MEKLTLSEINQKLINCELDIRVFGYDCEKFKYSLEHLKQRVFSLENADALEDIYNVLNKYKEHLHHINDNYIRYFQHGYYITLGIGSVCVYRHNGTSTLYGSHQEFASYSDAKNYLESELEKESCL